MPDDSSDRDERDQKLLPRLVRSLDTITYELGEMERAIEDAPRFILNDGIVREIVRRRSLLQRDADALLALVCDSRLEDAPN